jgi:hypothetical protein
MVSGTFDVRSTQPPHSWRCRTTGEASAVQVCFSLDNWIHIRGVLSRSGSFYSYERLDEPQK